MACVAVLVSFANAHAQTEALPEIFVTANRMGQELDSVLSEVDVLKKTDLENMGNANLTQALSKLPGFQGISYGRNAVYLRGSESRMTAVYVEGIRIESHDGLQLGGGAPWEMLHLEMVDRLEVVKGPVSAMYGSDAMGGVVQLFGKKVSPDDRPALTQSFGSFGLKQTAGKLSGKKQDFDYALSLSTSNSDGYDTRPDLLHTPSRERSSKDAGMVKLGIDLNRSNRLEWVYLDSSQSYQSAPSNYSGGSLNINHLNKLTANGMQWQRIWNEDHLSRIKLNSSEVAAESDAPNADDLASKFKTTTTTLSIDHEYITSKGVLTGLLEKKSDFFHADKNAYNAIIEGSRAQLAVGAAYSLKLDRHRVNASIRSDDYSHFSRHNTYSLGYGFELVDDWVVSAIKSTGFKAPSLEQMYGQYGSENLLPETNASTELAIQYGSATSKVRMTIFENSIQNLISSRPFGFVACRFCYYNVGMANIQGISLSGQTTLKQINLQSSLDWLDPVDVATGKQLSLRSKENFKLTADTSISDSRVGIEYQYIGKRFDDAANSVEFPAHNLVHVWTKSRLTPEWSWLNRIDNLLGEKYQQLGCTSGGVNTCNYAMPGVTFFTAIQWQPK
jgi:vitamin B12 transporter